jgi:hypothetical protein
MTIESESGRSTFDDTSCTHLSSLPEGPIHIVKENPMTWPYRFMRPGTLLLSLLFARNALSQSDSIVPPPPQILATTWFYWVLPLLATLVALTIGLRKHRQRVQVTIETWPGVDTTFSALCRDSLIITLVTFAAVMAVFGWVAFSPRTGDEWILHRTVAMSSIAVGLLVCCTPWLLAKTKWDH